MTGTMEYDASVFTYALRFDSNSTLVLAIVKPFFLADSLELHRL